MDEKQAEFVVRASESLLRLLPWLDSHRQDCFAQDFLAFRIKNPSSESAENDLSIWLDNEEITVGFGVWHDHFDESDIEDVALFMIEIMDGNKGVCEHYVSGRWQQSSLVDLEKPSEWPIKIRQIDEAVTIRGWAGILWEGRRP